MRDTDLHKQPTPKRLILSLLAAPGMHSITARESADWGRLFSIEPAAMRVALGRMVKGGFLRSAGRGVYVIGPQGAVLAQTARSWVDAETRIGDWNGEWLFAETAHLGRSDKTALRARERALRLEGFKPLQADLWCRPANLLEPLAATRDRLLRLGLDADALLLRAREYLGLQDDLAPLWPCRELEERYAQLTRAMRDSLQRLAALNTEEAARETFLIGEAVIRQINADPMLPDAMIDASARRTMTELMLVYDARGREAWTLFRQTAGENSASNVAPAANSTSDVVPRSPETAYGRH